VWFGGGQERGVRSGTQNVAAAVGLAAALQYMQTGREEEWRRLADLRDELWQRLQQDVSDLKLNGVIGKLLPGFLNIEVTAADGEELVARLDAAGLAVATGAACAAAHQEPSHVLRAMGRTSAQAGASLRLSLGRQTTQTQVETAAQTLARVIPRVRELASEPLA
jgi:cysteine desulfurase